MLLLALPAALAQAPLLPDLDGTDPHRWLEEIHSEAALDTVRRWNAATQEALEADPRFATMQAAALEILTSDERLVQGTLHEGHYYHLLRDEAHVRGLWRRAQWNDVARGAPRWEPLLDLDALASDEAENWVWGGFDCAPRSARCLVMLSRGGTDATVTREFSTDTRRFVEGGFSLPEAKSRASWLDEDTVLFGTDTGPESLTESGYARQIRRWDRGMPVGEAPVVFEAERTDVWAHATTLREGATPHTLFVTGHTFYDASVFYDRDGERVRLPLPAQHELVGMHRGRLLVLLNEAWSHQGQTFSQGSLVGVSLGDWATETVLEPDAGETIESVAHSRHSIVVQLLSDVVGRAVRVRRQRGAWTRRPIPLPARGQIHVVALSRKGDLLATYEGLSQPATQFHVSRRDEVTELQALPASFDASGVVVEQRFATSSDGTRVPYFLMARRDVLEAGPAPTIQYGYGGFMIPITPSYVSENARPQQGAFAGPLWVEAGGVLVLSNIRGGGEYGPAWHQAALKEHRQLAFDDFFAIGEALVADGVTTPDQLGAIGRSNGGLLMGVAFTQRPDLYAAIDCGVPLLDMLRYDKLLAGASWTGEYGDPDVLEERATLERYSPYHQLDPQTDYPSILLYTSTRDDRVHPGHARKMAAALESMGTPFYYWENIEGGHGGVANHEQAAYRLALEFLYFRRELGLE